MKSILFLKTWPLIARVLPFCVLEHGKSLFLNQRWVNHGCKSNEHLGLWKTQDGYLVFPGSLTNSVFQFLCSFTYHCTLKVSPTGGQTPTKLQKGPSSNVWPSRSIILEKLFLSPESLDFLSLDLLSTCCWTSLSFHLAWVINMLLLLYVYFLKALKPSSVARLKSSW